MNITQCPFCAANMTEINSWQTVGIGSHWEYAVMCTNCGALGPSDLGQAGAIEMWNLRREKLPEPYGQVKSLTPPTPDNVYDVLAAEVSTRQELAMQLDTCRAALAAMSERCQMAEARAW